MAAFSCDLALAQLDQDLLYAVLAIGGTGRTNQHFLQLEAVGIEFFAHLLARFALDIATLLQKLDQRLGLGDILEVGRNHRIERLFDEPLDVTETLHHERRLHIVDMHDDGERQHRFERILGDQRHFRQVLVQPVFAELLLRPFEHEVGGRHGDDIAGISIERIFARQQRRRPDTACADFDQFAVTVCLPGYIRAVAAVIGDDDTHRADVDDRLLDQFDGRENAIEEVATVGQHLQLPATIATGLEKLLRVLKIVVEVRVARIVGHGRRDDLAVRQGRTVMDGDDADHVLGIVDDDRLKAAPLRDHAGHVGKKVLFRRA